MKSAIGIVGLGMMGHGIALNILKGGYPLRALVHRNREPLQDLLKMGAVEAKGRAELFSACDIVFFCVTGAPEVEDLVYGVDGALEYCRSGFVLVDCTTQRSGIEPPNRRGFCRK